MAGLAGYPGDNGETLGGEPAAGKGLGVARRPLIIAFDVVETLFALEPLRDRPD
jgi:hypothetical protein